jgi:hypothetical protein
MRPELTPAERLSQVVFIHDYIQLVFQDDVFSIYNAAEVSVEEAKFSQGRPGFTDALIGLIESRATSVISGTEYSLQIFFEKGAVVTVLRGSAKDNGPEAWQFGSLGGPVIVEIND